MRLLILHSDYFRYEAVERTRWYEPVPPERRAGAIEGPVLVVFVCSEEGDEFDPLGVSKKGVEAIMDIAGRVGTRRIILHSFAHLSDCLSSPRIAKEIIQGMFSALTSGRYECVKTPFGWRCRFEISVKGHPLAKVSRRISPDGEKETI